MTLTSEGLATYLSLVSLEIGGFKKKNSLHKRRYFFAFYWQAAGKREASEERQTRACLELLARFTIAFARLKNEEKKKAEKKNAEKKNASYAG